MVLSSPECHRDGVTQHVTRPDWLLSLSHMHFSFLHVFSWLRADFFLVPNNIYLLEVPRFIHPFI